ncbi:hypothetical protein [Jiulongibacter sp. NS-SX5]|uniref:hypothetical protein n=1 Tax=Jiulongibacter sp. NS-SX5 TaxID=3463854 RepID=UPI004058AD5B
MKKFIATATLAMFLLTLCISAFSQTALKKMVTDDSNSAFKADTSIVMVNDSAFQKVVSVTYRFISEDILLEEFQRKSEYVKQQIEQERDNRERSTLAINKLKAELEAEKNFYRTARKQLKFDTKEADQISAKAAARKAEQENRRSKIEIRDNPRKPK